MRTGELALSLGRVNRQLDLAVVASLDAQGLSLKQYPEAVLAHDISHRFGHVGVLAAHQPLAALHDRHLATEAPEHLGKFEPHVAAAHDQQVFGKLVQFHNRCRVQGGHAVQALYGWVGGPGPDVDEDVVGGQLEHLAVAVQVDPKLLGTAKGGFAHQQVEALSVLDAPLVAAPKALHNVPLALAHLVHVDAYRAVLYTVVRRTAVKVGDLRTCHHRLGRGAALVDAGAAHVFALDERGLAPGLGERAGERHAALASADHDGVIVLRFCHRRKSFLLLERFAYCCTNLPMRPSQRSRKTASLGTVSVSSEAVTHHGYSPRPVLHLVARGEELHHGLRDDGNWHFHVQGIIYEPVDLASVGNIGRNLLHPAVGSVGLLHQVYQPRPYHRPVAPAPQYLGDIHFRRRSVGASPRPRLWPEASRTQSRCGREDDHIHMGAYPKPRIERRLIVELRGAHRLRNDRGR